jgi:hypothetical protein
LTQSIIQHASSFITIISSLSFYDNLYHFTLFIIIMLPLNLIPLLDLFLTSNLKIYLYFFIQIFIAFAMLSLALFILIRFFILTIIHLIYSFFITFIPQVIVIVYLVTSSLSHIFITFSYNHMPRLYPFLTIITFLSSIDP